ncbi:hypothetical protein AK830_g8642 [Neonectria ditissima]|uniref:Uncharacterized protein n=1 Tax=Neonectria ditissima TaxID=78410 RepID=A0A0P7BBZ4_9HYPO|nr:hypothetical protein AK830_g8642 [Neonectria ditissima]
MCLTYELHATDCDTRRRPVVTHLPFGNVSYHPFEDPPHCAHAANAKPTECAVHGSCCRVSTWQFCYANGVEEQCQGWQVYKAVISRKREHIPLNHFGPPLKPPAVLKESKPALECYMEVRRAFYEIGAHIACFGYEAHGYNNRMLEVDCCREEYEFLLRKLGETFDTWRQLCLQLKQVQTWWIEFADTGKMEKCPAKPAGMPRVLDHCHDSFKDTGYYLWPGVTLASFYYLDIPFNGPSIEQVILAAQRWLNRRRLEASDKKWASETVDEPIPEPVESYDKSEPAPVFRPTMGSAPFMPTMGLEELSTRAGSSSQSHREPNEKPLPLQAPEDSNTDSEQDEPTVIPATPVFEAKDYIPCSDEFPLLEQLSKVKKEAEEKEEAKAKKQVKEKKTFKARNMTKRMKVAKAKKEFKLKASKYKKRKRRDDNRESDASASKTEQKSSRL